MSTATLMAEHLERHWPEIAKFFAERNWPDTKLGNAAACINGDVHEIIATLRGLRSERAMLSPFQGRVAPFMEHCFGPEISANTVDRNHRFIEESLELAQSLGCSAQEAHMLVDYVFNRPVGQPHQEAGGAMVTLAALCLAAGLDMHQAGEDELRRVWGMIDTIREKQRLKPKGSPLPQSVGIDERTATMLAAISTAAIQNTRASAKERITKENPYWTAAYGDVCAAVDREMAERERADATASLLRDARNELYVIASYADDRDTNVGLRVTARRYRDLVEKIDEATNG